MFIAMREGNPRQNSWISFNNYGVKFKPLSELRAQAVYNSFFVCVCVCVCVCECMQYWLQ